MNIVRRTPKNILFLLILSFLIYQPSLTKAINTVSLPQTLLCNITRDLNIGMTGTDVKDLQKYLNSNGFILAQSGIGSLGKETNYFGPLTKQALIKFQIKNGLNSTGIFDSVVKNSLGCENESKIISDMTQIPFCNIDRDINIGMTGTDVKDLQKYLNSNGFILAQSGVGSLGKETNYFGPLTKQALIKFQIKNGLDSTGIFDSVVKNSLGCENESKIIPSLSYILNYTAVSGGTISGNTNQKILSGGNGTPVRAISNCGYSFTNWSDGSTINPRTDVNVTASKSVTANFTRKYYCGGGGSTSPNITTYNVTFNGNGSDGGSTAVQTLNYNTPTNLSTNGYTRIGYTFAGWNTVLDGSGTDYENQALYTIGSGDVSLFAKWAINTYSLIASSKSNGSITPSGTTIKNYGSSQSYQIEADDGYQIEDVLVDEVSVGIVDLYQFSNIGSDHTIEAFFETIPISVVSVSAITPSSGYDTKSITIDSIAGTGFRPGVSVKLTKSGEEDINCTNVIFENSTLISNALCNITSKEAGDWNMVITNNDTGTGELQNGFEIKEYEIGETGPLGGYIFYINENYESDGWKYMETAPVDQDSVGIFTKKWWNDTSTLIGGTVTGIGSGWSNTNAIVNGSSPDNNSAVGLAYNYSLNGYTDWFLPSQDELSLMYTNLHLAGIGGFGNTGYWSSSEVDSTNAIRRTFSGVPNNPETKTKISTYRTRAVRRFTTCSTYSISYNGNGNTSGDAPVDNSTYLTGSNVTILNENTLTKIEGYTFNGWNTASDGSGTDYATGSTLTMPANDVVLYAQWDIPNYTIAILPDTQSYVNWKPAEMTSQLNWLVDNKEDLNLKFVSHVGDIVQNWANDLTEWEFVQTEITKLKTAGIPYSLLPGNHDYAYMTRDSSVFNTYFPLSNFEDMSSSFGSYDEKSDNHYHIFEVDKDNNESPDDKILVLSLEFGPREEVVVWANQILENNSTIPAIVVTHAYLQPDGDFLEHGDNHAASNGYGLGADVYDGDELWENLIEPNDNVRFVFSGHDGESNDGSAIRTSYHQDENNQDDLDKPVYQIMANYQYYPVNEAGYLVLLNFNQNQVTMKTYSPWSNSYKTDAESQATWTWEPFNF